MVGLARASSSRFLEGSMNDRVSAVPPVEFIGHKHSTSSSLGSQTDQDNDYDDIAAEFLTCSSPRTNSNSTMDAQLSKIAPSSTKKSASTMGNKSKGEKRSSFLPSLWVGFREKLSFRKGETKRRPHSIHAGVLLGPRPTDLSSTSVITSTPPPEMSEPQAAQASNAFKPPLGMGMGNNGARPTREEVMANYKSLMAQGFFGNHAIQSTRQPPPKPLSTSQSMGNFAAISSNSQLAPGTADGLRSNPVPPTPTSMEQEDESMTPTEFNPEAHPGAPAARPVTPAASRPVSSPMDRDVGIMSGWLGGSGQRRGMKRSNAEALDKEVPTQKKLRKSASRMGDLGNLGRLRKRGGEISGFLSGRTFSAASSSSGSFGKPNGPTSPLVNDMPMSPHSPLHPNPFAQHPVHIPPHPAPTSTPAPLNRLKKRPTMADISAPLTPPVHMAPGAFEGMQNGYDVESLISDELPVKAVSLWEAQQERLLARRRSAMSELALHDARVNQRGGTRSPVLHSMTMDIDDDDLGMGIKTGDAHFQQHAREYSEYQQLGGMQFI
ncbi:hypothetical protein CFIMG_007485RA00001 [Ceratocystis fimbriata CBS 114723]|uniref:Uncharacterized protein n=1 Tax=Ceratocystis fimbriata CBS 114723 TaxID=1035309 RepID=A0A2C5XF70_9PEZI|nr:hypothetical protein CFIMG_007485RA00001 [Ceratocystis fimbriata CBS 114723]